ncbi:hypothetical protein NHX12_009024 [Muraenolepis orangiensis]|uniref:Uncharacterized protein n=1 Tax=Muraenolepis orangiensis TaxID=630683 RepID=A0A9Q0DR18_9TELE|nr:hypothetical protein NHX12_009024 [Muraenolepis orangiensis]
MSESVGVKRSDQRKVRSRDAARCRRSQETEIFYELAQSLPLPHKVSANLDKAAIMRVTLSYLRMYHLLKAGEERAEPQEKDEEVEKEEEEKEKEEEEKEKEKEKEEEEEEEEEEDCMDGFYPRALAGFIMVLTDEGDMVYVSDSVSKHIGIAQLELLGQSVYDFVHPCDVEELRDLLTARPGTRKKPDQWRAVNVFLRVKSTLTSRGVEFPLDSSTFLTRHSMDLVTELVGYEPDDLIGRSAYEFHHSLDSDHINRSLHTLLSKGQVCTSQYRFLAKKGGFVWAETQATILYNSRTSSPEAVVCLNFILSAVEKADMVFSVEQTRSVLPSQPQTPATPVDISDVAETLKENPEEDLLQLAPQPGEDITDLVQLSFPSSLGSDQLSFPSSLGSDQLSFSSPLGSNSLLNFPQDLCTPELRELLAPIFDIMTPPPSSSSSSPSLSAVAVSPRPEVEDKRQRRDVSPMDRDLLFTHRLLDCLDDTDQSDLELEPRPQRRSQLLTDRDPVLGGIQGLCDTAALMRDVFSSRPPDRPPLSLLT